MNESEYRTTAVMVLGLMCFVGFSLWLVAAYGETFEDVISFPIPDNITGQEKVGHLETLTDDLLEFSVTYRFHLGQNGTQWFDDIIMEYGLVPPEDTLCPDRFYLGEDDKTCYPTPPIESNFVPQKKSPELTRYETDFDKFTEKPPVSVADKDYFALLKELETCMRGINESRGIATTEQFDVSTAALDPEYLQSVDLTGTHAKLALAVEECKVIRTILNPVTLGVESYNKGLFFENIQPYHSDKAIVDEDEWVIVPTHPEPLSPHDFEVENSNAHDRMCESDRVTKLYKTQQGCSEYQIYIECPFCVVSYESPAMNKYYQYLQDDGVSLLKELKAKTIAEKQRELREYIQ